MQHKDIDKVVEIINEELKNKGISRRDALKIAAVGSAAFMLNPSESKAATPSFAAAQGKVVIIGGGLAGVSTASKLISSGVDAANITVIEPNPESVSYQPGQTLVASGIWQKSDIMYKTADFMPSGVKWVKDKAVDVNGDANKVITANSGEVAYDFLVVAAGLTLNYKFIKGLDGDITSLGENAATRGKVGKNGMTSIYFADGAVDTWKEMQKFISDAKGGKKVKGVFSSPHTPIKCGGAPKKIMFLTDSRLREVSARSNAELEYYDNGGAYFGVKEYAESIKKKYEEKNLKAIFSHNLIEVDAEKKIAVFNKHSKVKGAWDPDLEEYKMEVKNERIEVPYDFLHVTPPQKAPDEIGKSSVGSEKGWVPVAAQTLQHVKYKNVFALGDIAAVPLGKTGGSTRKQYKVVAENLVSVMNGKEPTSKYGGYTVCPLITEIGKVMMLEFDWADPEKGNMAGKMAPSLPFDPNQDRWLYWFMKAYMLKPMTIYGMLSGRA